MVIDLEKLRNKDLISLKKEFHKIANKRKNKFIKRAGKKSDALFFGYLISLPLDLLTITLNLVFKVSKINKTNKKIIIKHVINSIKKEIDW